MNSTTTLLNTVKANRQGLLLSLMLLSTASLLLVLPALTLLALAR